MTLETLRARLAVLALAALALAAPAAAQSMQLGSPKAPVTVVEYASVGCPHCATWATKVFPAFKARYVDTGKVRFEFREMLTGDPQLAAAGFLVADCAPQDRYFQIVDDIFADQAGIARGGVDALFRVAERAGMTRPRFDACLSDAKALQALQTRTEADATAHHVDSTPTFLVGSQKLVGDVDLDTLTQAIARAGRHG
ncbi:MAG TPA: thioredoxin domain-containing protein [Caulobacteraceae bacterium]|jgi:protein-disulfide isomerase|nr:thioredoxin domain-containing protein [Caulobacteraceae bacterium]